MNSEIDTLESQCTFRQEHPLNGVTVLHVTHDSTGCKVIGVTWKHTRPFVTMLLDSLLPLVEHCRETAAKHREEICKQRDYELHNRLGYDRLSDYD